MKLVHPEVGFQILWEENKIPVCIIEAPNRWRVFQKEFRAQSLGEDGKWILSEDDKIMDWKKNVEMIFNPIVLDENQRKIMTSFLSNLEKQIINEKYWKKGQELNGVIQQFFGELETEFPFDFSIDGEINYQALAKAMNIHIEYDTMDDLERLLQYCILVKELLNPRLFVFWNLHDFFEKKDLELLYHEFLVRDWKVMLMETRQHERIAGEKMYIIDCDNCEIY